MLIEWHIQEIGKSLDSPDPAWLRKAAKGLTEVVLNWAPLRVSRTPLPLEHFPPAAPHLLSGNQSMAAASISVAAMLLA